MADIVTEIMTEIEENAVNIRKRRILKACEEDDDEKTLSIITSMNLSSPMANKFDPEEFKQRLKSFDNDPSKMFGMKLKVFDEWESSKRRGMEKFVKGDDDEKTLSAITSMNLSSPIDNKFDPEEFKQRLKSVDNDPSKMFDMKLKVLDEWESSKRREMEKLVKDDDDDKTVSVITSMNLSSPMQNKSDPEEFKQKLISLNKESSKIVNMKLKILEEWGIEKFVQDDDDEKTLSVITCMNLSSTGENESDRKELMEKLKALHKDPSKIIDMKLKVLEGWELCKRRAIEKLVKDVEELQQLEDDIDKMEELLLSKNIEIDEIEFEKYYQKKLKEDHPLEPLDYLYDTSPQTPKREEHQNKRIKISATSTPITRKPIKEEIIDKFVANEEGMVVIGPNGTTIAKNALQAINWSLSGAALTRKILMEVFDRETLAFHTLTGKPSPAFMDCDKPMKNQLDPLKVADIIHLVMKHTKMTAKEVRNAITTKCADENKMFRQREKKRQKAALKLQQS